MASSRADRLPPGLPQVQYHLPGAAGEAPPPLADRGLVTLAWDSSGIYVRDEARLVVRKLLALALRDSCICRRCRDVDSGNKRFRSTELPAQLAIVKACPDQAGLGIVFGNDFRPDLDDDGAGLHHGLVAWETVEVALGRRGPQEAPFPRLASVLSRTGVDAWDAAGLDQQVRTLAYADYMGDDGALWTAVADLCRLGIVYLDGVPRDPAAVLAVTTRLAPVRETLYGRSFDVRAKPAADNVAYTSRALGLHQDLLYLQPPPMIQLLHCLDGAGPRGAGDSLFSDAERVARLLMPFAGRCAALAPLFRTPVDYHYARHGFHYHRRRPVLRLAADGLACEVNWSPPFQAPHASCTADLGPWLAAARLFEDLVSADAAVHRRRLLPGQCVLFNNRRLLHGRTAFAPDAARWLRGAYISPEDFLSRAVHLPSEHAPAVRDDYMWTGEYAQRLLRASPWFADVRRRVALLDPELDDRCFV